MALPTSGPLSLAQIQTEFGGSNPIGLNEYYAGGANVPSGTSGTYGAVPSSGTISIRNFYGTQKVAPTFTFTISSNQDRANLRSLAVAAGWNQSSAVIATLAGGVWIYSATTATPALTIDGSWPGGVTLINNGNIVGMGGAGGGGGNTLGSGGNGGTALAVSVPVTIQNNSNVAGGGGGGGGGGYGAYTYNYVNYGAGGGGGGGGRSGLANSGGGAAGVRNSTGLAGGSGTSGGPGGGGGGSSYTNVFSATGAAGASGGGWGAAGGTGGTGTTTSLSATNQAGAGGGAGGFCATGSGNITWSATGNRFGPFG
jgi:hypothetical protein